MMSEVLMVVTVAAVACSCSGVAASSLDGGNVSFQIHSYNDLRLWPQVSFCVSLFSAGGQNSQLSRACVVL